MSEATILSEPGSPSTQDNAPSTVYPECWETTEHLAAEKIRTQYATHPDNSTYVADSPLTKDKKLRRQIAATTNCDLHRRCHTLSGRVKPDEPCDWEATHDSKGNRIEATSIRRVTPTVPTRADGRSDVHTCRSHWVGSGRLTADEETSLQTANREYSQAQTAVCYAEEAVFKEVPHAKETEESAKKKKLTAFSKRTDLLYALDAKYPRCFTCQSEAISASLAEESLIYVKSSQQTSDGDNDVPTE